MKAKYLLLVGCIIVFGSCSTAYRTGQTPDDVYYSPAPDQKAYVRSDNQDDRETYGYNNSYDREERDMRRGISDVRYRNNLMLNLGYGYNPYMYGSMGYYNPYVYSSPYSYINPYGLNYGFNYNPYAYNFYDPYYTNYFASPYYNYYYSPQVYVTPVPSKVGNVNSNVAGPRRYNLGAYNNRPGVSGANTPNGYRPMNSSSAPIRSVAAPSQRNRDAQKGNGGFLRRVFTPNNNNNNNDNGSNRVYRNRSENNNYDNSNSTPLRSVQSSSSSSGGSNSSSGSSSAPTRTFRK